MYHHEVVDSKYCNECAEMLQTAKEMSYTRCAHCHQFSPKENITILGKLKLGYCDKCASKAVTCQFCGDIIIPDNPKERVCSFCFDSNSRVCVRCKRNFLPEKKHYDTCPDCYNTNPIKNDSLKHKKNIDEIIEEKEKAFDTNSLIESFADSNTRSTAIKTIISMGDQAVNPLIESLDHKNDVIQDCSIQCLVKMGEIAVEPLIDGLDFINDEMRANCAKALGEIQNDSAVKPLISVLEDDYEPLVRAASASALGSISNKNSLDILIQALKTDNDPKVRRNCALAIGNIGNEEGLEPLIEAMSDESKYVADASVLSISKMKGSSFLNEMMDSKTSEEDDKESEVIDLGLILDTFIDKIENEDLKINLEDLLNSLDVSADDFIKKIVGYLDRAPDDDKIVLIDILGETRNQKAIKPLINYLKDDNTLIRWSAKESLEKIASENLEVIIQYLENKNEDVRYVIAHILMEINDDRVIEPLLNSLYDPDPDIRHVAFEFFSKRDDEQFMTHLPNLTEDENIGIRIAAIKLLGKKGDESALESLKNALEDEDFKVIKEAKKSIRSIQKKIGKKQIKKRKKKKSRVRRKTSKKDLTSKKHINKKEDHKATKNPMKLLNDLRSRKTS